MATLRYHVFIRYHYRPYQALPCSAHLTIYLPCMNGENDANGKENTIDVAKIELHPHLWSTKSIAGMQLIPFWGECCYYGGRIWRYRQERLEASDWGKLRESVETYLQMLSEQLQQIYRQNVEMTQELPESDHYQLSL